MNNITISGNITADATIRGNEKKAANFTVAVKGYGDHTDFIRCTAFGPAAEYVEKYGKKGVKAVVNGSLHIGSYEKDGNKVPTAEVYVQSVELTSKTSAKAENATAETAAPAEAFAEVDDDCELPFN